MNSEQIIHIKLEYDEALELKRQTLNSETTLLQLRGSIQRYHKLRSLELKQKSKLQRDLKEVITGINKLHVELPQIRIPRILENGVTEKHFEILKQEKSKKYDNSIESQLKEIQSKLNSMR
jgi:hypothetical protein